LLDLNDSLPEDISYPITFEIISHRYTTRAKNTILQVFPSTQLPMIDEERQYKYGQFGYGKFVYNKLDIAELKDFFTNEIDAIFKNKVIKYII
jgi:spore photoproduct lyase